MVISRTPRHHRGTTSQVQKQTRQARIRLKQAVAQLQEWHAVPGNIGTIAYDATTLDVKTMEQHNWQIPWSHSGSLAGSVEEQRTDLQQRIQRCDEELLIIARECNDMVTFYEHRISTMQAAWDKRQADGLQVTAAAFPDYIRSQHSHDDQQQLHVEYVEGQKYMLAQMLDKNRLLLSQASALSKAVQHAAENGNDIAEIGVADGFHDMQQVAAQPSDPADTDVGDFIDLPAAEDFMPDSDFESD